MSVAKIPNIIGGICWFSNPRTIYDAVHGRTLFGFVGLGGQVVVGQISDAGNMKWTVLKQYANADDHDNPSFCQFPDGRIAVFYAHHQATDIQYRVSDTTGDITTLGAEMNMGVPSMGLGACNSFSYCNPMVTTADGRLMVLFRQNFEDHNRWIAVSNFDYLATNSWSGYPLWYVPARDPYLVARSNGVDRIDFFVTSCHPATDIASAYHFYFYFDGTVAHFRKSDGSNMPGLSSYIYGPSDASLVVSGPGVGNLWNNDIALASDGKPCVLFDSYPGNDPQTSKRQYARLNASNVWNVTPICDGGASLCPDSTFNAAQVYYTNGSCFDGGDGSKVILGRTNGQDVQTIERWATSDAGATFVQTDTPQQVLTGDKLYRPISPAGYVGGPKALWMRGAYPDYTSLDSGVEYLAA